MSRERAKILRMVADGTITPDDAEKLLNRLGDDDDAPVPALADGKPRGGAFGPLKYLRVVVEGRDNVNIRVPLALVRTGIKLSTLMPTKASSQLAEHGVDLSRLQGLEGEELLEALRELSIDVEAENGDVIHVFCE